MSELSARFRVELSGGDGLLSFLERANTGTTQLERNANRSFAAISAGAKQTGEDMSRLAITAGKTALSISGLSLGITAQSRGVLEFRDSVQRLATASGLADSQIGGLKDQILDTSVATGQLKDKVTEALGAFVAKTGDIETGRRNLELYARTATGTGAALSEVALIGAELSKKMGLTDQRGALGILAKQGDIGAIEFKDLASQGPRLFASAASAGLVGEAGVRKIGGLAQLFAEGRGGSGAAASVATSIENLLADVSSKKGQTRIGELGIEVGDRDAVEIAKDVIVKLGGNDRAIARTGIFGKQAMRGIQTMSRTFRETGAFAQLDKFTNVSADDNVIAEKFGRNIGTGKSQLGVTQARADRAFDQNLGNLVERLARGSGAVGSAYEFAVSNPGTILGGGVAALFARNAIKSWAGGGSSGGALGGLLGGGGQRVFVTNWPAGGGGFGGLGNAAAGATEKLGTLKMMAQNASAILGVFAASVAAGAALGNYLEEKHGDKIDAYLGDPFGIHRGRSAIDVMDKDIARQKVIRDQRRAQRGENFINSGLPIADFFAKQVGAAPQELKEINITINDGKVEVEGTGTQKPAVKFRRGGGG
jgi:hypothetical protein